MQEIIHRLLSWKNGNPAYPYSLELSPTLRCNLNCLFCWRHSVNRIDFGKELDFSVYKRIIEEAKSLDVKEIKIIGGGEATYRKDTIQIMELVKKNNMFGYICTNGTLFNVDDIIKLIEIGWDHIKISLHGPNQNIHDVLTQKKGSFIKAIHNIRSFTEYRHTQKPIIEIGIVLVNRNYNSITEFVELAHKMKLNSLFLEPITVYSQTGGKLILNKHQIDETKKLLKKAIKLATKYKISHNFDSFITNNLIEKTNRMIDILSSNNKKNNFSHLPCYEPFYRVGIRVDGTVCPCGFFDEDSYENIKEKSLRDIWFGEYFNKRRKDMLNNSLSDYCKKCCTTLVVNNLEIRRQLKGL